MGELLVAHTLDRGAGCRREEELGKQMTQDSTVE